MVYEDKDPDLWTKDHQNNLVAKNLSGMFHRKGLLRQQKTADHNLCSHAQIHDPHVCHTTHVPTHVKRYGRRWQKSLVGWPLSVYLFIVTLTCAKQLQAKLTITTKTAWNMRILDYHWRQTCWLGTIHKQTKASDKSTTDERHFLQRVAICNEGEMWRSGPTSI